MISRRNLIGHFCPTCDTEFTLLPELAGHELPCPSCKSSFRVPQGLPARTLDVSTDPGTPLTAEETAEFYNSPAGQAYLARKVQTAKGALARRIAPSELVPESYERRTDARHPVASHDDDKKVKLAFGEYAQMEVDVDKPTRNAMAMGFLGAVMALLGVVVAAMFGIKKRS